MFLVSALLRGFRQRSAESEWMDDPASSFPIFASCLMDLRKVNVLTLGYMPVVSWLKSLKRQSRLKDGDVILDVGSGGGDTLRVVAEWASEAALRLTLIGIDLNPWAKKFSDAQSNDPSIKFVTSNIFDLNVSLRPDFIMSSLFTHHLSDQDVIAFMQWMESRAQKGWLINDLHRHPVPYIVFRYGSRFLGWDPMVCHDGPISIARAFTKDDWRRYASAAQIPIADLRIRWKFPFRISIERNKT